MIERPAPTPSLPAAPAGQVLCFQLAAQEYALSILEVKEIRRYCEPTSLPDVPRYVLGVINLRGAVVPVFDLRLRFGIGAPTIDRTTAIIVVSVADRSVGLVVDAVTRVESVPAAQVRPTPQFAGGIDSSFVLGLIAAGDRLVTWLDAGQLVRGDLEAS